MKKRICIWLVAIALLAGVSPVRAAEPAQMDAGITAVNSDFLTTVTGILSGMAQDPYNAALDDIDFDELALGAAVPAYTMSAGGTLRAASTAYYPILDADGHIVLLVTVHQQGGCTSVQISDQYAAELDALAAEGAGVALIYTQDGLYTASSNSAALSSLQPEAAAPASAVSAAPSLPIGTVPAYATISASDAIELAPQQVGISKYLNVPICLQPTENTCWAACASAVGEYYRSMYISPQVLVDASGNGDDVADAAVILDLLDRFYDLTGFNTYKHFEDGLQPCPHLSLTFSTYISYIDGGRPLIALFNNGQNSHWVVLRGYNVTGVNDVFSVMDPLSSNYIYGSFGYSTEYETATWEIVPGGNDSTHTMVQYLVK